MRVNSNILLLSWICYLLLILHHRFSSSFLVEDRKFLWKSRMYLYYSPTGQVSTIFLKSHSIPLKNWLPWECQSSRARLGWHSSRLNLNFSKTVTGITKWFWVTIKGCLGYTLSKFEDLVPTSLSSGPRWILFTNSLDTQYIHRSFIWALW